jgi:hypothetical protein
MQSHSDTNYHGVNFSLKISTPIRQSSPTRLILPLGRSTRVCLAIKGLFGSVVAVAFQIAFRAKMHANDVFFIFLKSFLTSAHQNDLKTLKTY